MSVASLWKIVVKAGAGKLKADISAIGGALRRDHFDRLMITPSHLATLVGLPLHHRDPFDHLLIAQAISEDVALVSDDQYGSL